METTGMTQGGLCESPSDLEMELPQTKDDTESMEDDQDLEV